MLAAARRGGPRSGASLFLRPNRVAPASTYRSSIDETMHTMSRTYSISEVPQLEEAASAGLSSSDGAQPLLGALPPPSAARHLPTSAADSAEKAEEHVESPVFTGEPSSPSADDDQSATAPRFQSLKQATTSDKQASLYDSTSTPYNTTACDSACCPAIAEGKSAAAARAKSLYTAILYGLINGIVGKDAHCSY